MKSESIKISIVIVCKDEATEAIDKTLQSVISQSYLNNEIVFIDGKSNNSTLDALKRYETYFDYFLTEPDKGIFDAMNKGVKYSTGDWIIFMNIGDLFFNNRILEKLALLINTTHSDADIIYGDAFHEGIGVSKAPNKINRFSLLAKGICHQAMLIRRKCFEDVGLYDTKYSIGGDPDWNLRAFLEDMIYRYSGMIICIYKGRGFRYGWGRSLSG